MMRKFMAIVAVAAGAVGTAYAAEPPAKAPAPKADLTQLTFGTLRSLSESDTRAKLTAWLTVSGKFDVKAIEAIYAGDKAPLEKFLATVAIGEPALKKIIDDARDLTLTPPTEVPAAVKAVKDPFVKSNLAMMFARTLSARKVYEEAIAATVEVVPEQLIEPSAFYFFKTVAEHSVAGYDKKKKVDALSSVQRLLDDVLDAPDRYRTVATLIFFDIQNWAKDDKDLGNIGKLMDNSGRRLDLARGGKTTQDIQKKILFRLDEKIKELENQQKGS